MERRERPKAPSRSLGRRRLLRTAAAAALGGAAWIAPGVAPRRTAAQEEARFLRIGTGPTSGSYFSIGSIIANAVSNPPGSRPCEAGGSCGVPGLVAIAQTTQGSVENVKLVADKLLDSGLCQADIAFWAYTGSGMYRGEQPLEGLRAIANLYQESLHVVVRADSTIDSISDLKGKRVSLGERGAGTRATAALVLDAYGVNEKKFTGRQLPIAKAASELREKKIDALFFVGVPPVPALVELAETTPLRLLPVEGATGEALRRDYLFATVDVIPERSYGTAAGVVTVGIGTYWLVLAELDDGLAHGLAEALWHEATRKLLDQGGPLGRRIRIENALVGLPIPIHAGAARYYTHARARKEEPADGTR